MPELIRKLLDLLTRHEQVQLIGLLAVLLLVAVVEVVGIASIMPFMAVVTNPDVIHTNHWLNSVFVALGFQSEKAFLIFLGVIALVLLVLSNLIKAASTWLTLRYHNKLNYVLARRLLASYMAQPYSFFLNRNTSELGKNILAEVRTVVGGVLNPATSVVSNSLVTVAIMSLLIAVDPVVALAIATVLGGVYGAIYLAARRRLAVIGRQQVQANAEKYKSAGEGMSGIKDLKVLGREQTLLIRFAKAAELHARNNVTAGLISQMPRFALEIVAFGGILIVVLHLLGKGQEGAHVVPLLALYAFAGYRLMPALQQLFASFTQLRQSAPALELLHRDLADTGVGRDDPEARLAATSHAEPLPFTRSIELQNLSFRYEGAPEPALRSISLAIQPKTSVGLVGPTGCGKTTTVDIILGLLTPSEGDMLVDGVEITPNNLPSWQRNLGYVPQQIYISDDTVARNIAFGIRGREIDMEAVHRAAKIANLADFVENELAEGYETHIGERGLRLSGGQRQRIGIARALYRDPDVLVMDEATSALDGITEESVMEAVRTLSRKKTIILIAHRLTTVRECDVIYVLDHGRIVSTGSFEELKQSSAWFRAASGV